MSNNIPTQIELLRGLKALAKFENKGPVPTADAEGRKVKMAEMQKNATTIASLLTTPHGMAKLGAALTNPVLQFLDYEGISRYFLQVETLPAGVPFIYNWDLNRGYSVQVADGGNARAVIMRPRIVEIQPFTISSHAIVLTDDLYDARFALIDRAKERVAESMRLREDLISFSQMTTAAGAAVVASATMLTKQILARIMRNVEQNRLNVQHILGSPVMVEAIRGWQWQDIDQIAMQEIRQAGYLGEFWGSQIWINDQITNTEVYCIAPPEFVGWMPFRKEVTVTVAPVPWQNHITISGYERLGMTWYNSNAVKRGTFTITSL